MTMPAACTPLKYPMTTAAFVTRTDGSNMDRYMYVAVFIAA